MSNSKKSFVKFFRSIDLFGQNILLNLNGEDQYKTVCGGLMTLVILAIVVLFFQSNLKDFINKVNIQSESNQVFEDQPDQIYLNDTNFMFAVAIEQTNFNSNPFFNITIASKRYERQGDGSLSKEEALLDLVPCTVERFQQIFSQFGQNFSQQYNEIGLDTWLCPQMNYSFTLKGRYSNKLFDFLKITVSQCSNQSETNSFYTWYCETFIIYNIQSINLNQYLQQPICASNEDISQWLMQQRQYRVKIYITNQMINPQKGDEYVQSFLDDELFFSFVPQVVGKEADIFFTKYLMQTDNNLLPTGSAFDKKELFAKEQGDYRDQNSFASDIYATIYFRRSPYTTYISRSYQKLDKMLSILGGFANIVIVVLGFFVGMYCIKINIENSEYQKNIQQLYNKQLYLIELANQIYDFNFGQENQEKFEREKLVQDITYLKSQPMILSRCSPTLVIELFLIYTIQSTFFFLQFVISRNIQNLFSLGKNYRMSIRQTFSQKFDYLQGVKVNKDESCKMIIGSHWQPIGDKEVEWQSADAADIYNNHQIDVSDMIKENAKNYQEDPRISKDQTEQDRKKSCKEIHQKIVRKIGNHNRKEYLTKQIQAMLDRSRPIVFTIKFLLQVYQLIIIIHQLFCGKFFQDQNSILLNKAIKKINSDIDICVLIDKVNEIELIKELLLNKDQQILFNFAPKEVITIENEYHQHQPPGRRENKRAFTKTLGVQFGDVAKMMLDKKFKKGQFVTPGMQIYYKLYSAYEKVALSDEKNNRFNQILIEKLGQEVKDVFDISNYIQGDQNTKTIEKLRKKKTFPQEEEQQPIGLTSMDYRDVNQSMIK